MKKSIIVDIISYVFILVFLYTAFSKVLAYETTLFDMRRNPFLEPYAALLAVGVPLVEVVISVLLFFPKTRLTGLKSATVLMALFTGYVGFLLASDSKLPCTCGGVIREMSWTQHLIFNIFLAGLGVWGWIIQSRSGDKDSPNRNYAIA